MRHIAIAVLTIAAMSLLGAPTAGDERAETAKAAELPKSKQTSLELYVTAKEAYARWKAAPEEVKVLDVRTPEEYIHVGHATMAWNIPFAFQSYRWDSDKQHFAMEPHVDFVVEVKGWAEPTDTILVMCRSGGRSAKAVDRLAKAGFTKVYSIIDGMEGDKVDDPESVYDGKRLKNGWKNSGLPWTYEVDPDRMRLPNRRAD